jgi:hypothetical protein
MIAMKMVGLFDEEEVPDEPEEEAEPLPLPEVCPCTVVNNFRCPARKKGKLLKLCVGAQNYRKCGNYSSWFWYKVAEQKAKQIESPEK